MTLSYLGTSGFLSSGGTWTPPAGTTLFIFGMAADGSGGSGSQWSYVRWDGFTDSIVDANVVNYAKKTTTNTHQSALWELDRPDISGLGQLTFSAAGVNVQRGCIMAFGYANVGDPIYDEDTVTAQGNPVQVDPGWIGGGIKVGVIAAVGDSETSVSGFTEVSSHVLRAAMGYRATDGYVGWTVTNIDRAALCAAILRPARTAGGIIVMD